MLSNTTLIEHLIEANTLRSTTIIEAFSLIDRKDFVPEPYKNVAYMDNPLPIGHDATISQPTTVAFMLELLQPAKGNKVLDIGAGSGWTTALIASIVGTDGVVLGIEIVPELVEQGLQNIQKYDLKNCCIDRATQQGLPAFAPFDKILVSAAAEELPDELLQQLAVGGTLVIPIQHAILRVQKTSEEDIAVERYPGFAFVPLQDTREKGET